MAESTDNEETTENSEVVEQPAATVKKKAAKKRVAKKKVAKKKAASKKTAVKKAPESVNGSTPEGKESGDAKPATATAVAAAAASDTRPPPHTETVVKARLIKDEPPEETAMSTESASAGSFWVKVIFWVVIIVLGFIYIRTLAKHPGEQSVAPKSEESREAVTAPTTSSQMVAPFDLSVGKESETAGGRATDSGDASSAVGGESVTGETESSGHPAVQPPAAVEQRSTITESSGAVAPAVDADSSTAGEAAAEADRQSMRARHEESVARILKEFDDLREAARAEMEAMHNLIQAERELRDAMAPPPPPVYPGWRGPDSGYGPYGPPPQNYPPY